MVVHCCLELGLIHLRGAIPCLAGGQKARKVLVEPAPEFSSLKKCHQNNAMLESSPG